MSEWQPIATAPTDGTEILLWLRGEMYRPVEIGYWLQRKTKKAKSGWRSVEHPYFLDGPEGFGEPTHWMPLPSPPKEPTP